MDFYWVKTSRFIKWLFPRFVWDRPNPDTVFLTFDDGPTPGVTPWVLDLLKAEGIQATFFCIGANIEKQPEIFARILAEGHAVGNHTQNHRNGWKTSTRDYLQNFEACRNTMAQNGVPDCRLFRPPYGKIKRRQASQLLAKGQQIVMWDILTVDYNAKITPEQCLENATRKTVPGSILIFHDSVKAQRNLQHALPATIKILKEKGFGFAELD